MAECRERYLYWSRCKLGEGRWYWVISEICDDNPTLADGMAASESDALAAVEAAAAQLGMTIEKRRPYEYGRRVPGQITQGNASWAASRHSDKCKARRREKVTKETGSRMREYLYTHHIPEDPSWAPYWLAHPILKKTPKRVWVADRVSCPVEDLGTDKEAERFARLEWDDSVTVLDRAKLERDGHASTRTRWYVTFYLKPEFDRGQVTAEGSPELHGALEVLGLSWPCTADDVKKAYRRLSRETHPDVGGSAEQFRRVNEAYERASAVAV